MKRKSQQSGFGLFETLISVALMVVLLSVFLPNALKMRLSSANLEARKQVALVRNLQLENLVCSATPSPCSSVMIQSLGFATPQVGTVTMGGFQYTFAQNAGGPTNVAGSVYCENVTSGSTSCNQVVIPSGAQNIQYHSACQVSNSAPGCLVTSDWSLEEITWTVSVNEAPSWSYAASPTTPGLTGSWSYYASQDGILRCAPAPRTADANAPAC